MTAPVKDIKFTYFGTTGKFYTSSEWDLPREMPYNDGMAYIRQALQNGYLPGLGAGGWEGYILVEIEGHAPRILFGDDLR